MYLKNKSHLLPNEIPKDQLILRHIGLEALEKAIAAVKPKNLIEKSIRLDDNILLIKNDEYNLQKFNKIYIIGGGKATLEMALSLEKLLSNSKNIDYKGLIIVPETQNIKEISKNGKISINYGSHPIPNESGLKGTLSMMNLIKESSNNDLVICLISGGGSALLPLPKKGVKFKDLQNLNSLLLESGVPIHEINIIRKHLSEIKGGNLAKNIYKISGATLISIIISDVVGDKLESIASGPSVPDTSTFNDAIGVLKKYNIYEKIPMSVKHHLEKGLRNDNLETPKFKDECFNNVHNYIIGSVKTAVEEVISFLNVKGFKTFYFSDKIDGEAFKFGEQLYTLISQKFEELSKESTFRKYALIGTGELTVKIKGDGIGGRNQEMLLSFLNVIKEQEIPYEFLVMGTNLDGIEGNSEAMGALIDNYVLKQIYKNEIDTSKYLENNDSNSFFKIVKTEIITGLTGCNVNDLFLVLLQFKE